MKKRNYPAPKVGASDQQLRNEHEEKELITSVENEEWTSVSDFDYFKKSLMQAAAEQKVLFDSLMEKMGQSFCFRGRKNSGRTRENSTRGGFAAGTCQLSAR